MPTKDFDEKFQICVKEIIDSALDFIANNKNEISEIYIFSSFEDDLTIFNLFFKINNKISRIHQLNSYTKSGKFDLSEIKIITLLKKSTTILMEIQNLFKSDSRQIPSHIKIIYNCNQNNWKADFNYELNLNETLSVHDIFDSWINEINNSLNSK